LKYFSQDQKYFDFVKDLYDDMLVRVTEIYSVHGNIENQKDFAITIMPLCSNSCEKGVIFSARKRDGNIKKVWSELDSDSIYESLNLKDKFANKFGQFVENTVTSD
jgi:hypothetical protein